MSASGPHKSCQHAVELLCDYLDNALDAATREGLEKHLSACPPCVEFLNTYKATTGLCRRALESKMPEELAGRLTSFLRDKIKK